jgi:acetyl-CoA synthetase
MPSRERGKVGRYRDPLRPETRSATQGESMAEPTIEGLLAEERRFAPPESFKQDALVVDTRMYDDADRDFEGFWARQALALDWSKEWDTILDWDLPFAKWFVGGELNVSQNCLDRHVEAGHGDKVAYHWEGEPGDTRTITYAELLDEVSRLANGLKELGVRKGDRVAIYLGMVPELPMAMLACARIGAAHSVVFGGFSKDSLRDRINDAECTVLVTGDGAWRRGNVVPLKATADDAVAETPSIEKVLVVRRTEHDVAMQEGRDVWYHDLVPGQSTDCPPEAMDSEDLLFILYTSGTTGRPKGIMHTTGGYLTQVAFTHRHVFDLRPDTDVYWCAADCGWVTGHSYIVYGPLANRATSVMYEGTPDHPGKDRFWSIIERYGVTILYTAPTAIRTFMKWGTEFPAGHDLSSLRLLGSVGEPINPEAWIWYWTHIGGERCPVVDTWWQTETGAIMISPLPGATTLKPGSATFPLPGIGADVVDEHGTPVPIPGGGYLVLTRPWPSMLRGIWGDPERYRATYWSEYEGRYFAGDGAKRDADGYFWLLGRVDDIMLVSGHNISTTEVESALVGHPAVAEAAVVGKTDATSGQAIGAFVILRAGYAPSDELGAELRDHVAHVIGPIAKPKTVLFTEELPKTRSGKIMRRLLRNVAEDEALGDTTTLADPSVVEGIKQRYLSAPPSGDDA